MLADFLIPNVRLLRIYIHHKRIQIPVQKSISKMFWIRIRIPSLRRSHFAKKKIYIKNSIFGHDPRLLPDPDPDLKQPLACAFHEIIPTFIRYRYLVQNVSFLKNCVEASQMRLCLLMHLSMNTGFMTPDP
jgi:hypothetical protein